nr:polycomb protein Sfmbt-like [Cherax quadricarinatus]
MLWYGVTGVSFNPADPAEVMLNTGTAAPLLSDHPRPLVPTPVSYSDPMPTQHTQMLYDPNTGDYITQPEYMYESYDNYDEDSSGSHVMQQQGTPPITEAGMVGQADESPPPVPKSKKPKVHHHPALKLKTPIAYQKDTDLSAIPIMREGMAVCEKCGAIGVKHAFYGKERKFCSLACARGPLPPSQQMIENPLAEKEVPEEQEKSVSVQKAVGQATAAQQQQQQQHLSVVHPQPSSVPTEPLASPTYLPPPESTIDLDGTFSWSVSYLDDPNFRAVPVSCFRHAPMSECWEQMSAGMKVEVACGEEGVTKDAFWVATVVTISGYKAKLRFEGFVEDSSKDFWVDLCSEEVHPVGWCATQGRPLIPPRTIQHKYRDWKEFLMRRLTGARTLPTNFVSRVVESQKSRFRPGLNLEVVDKNRIAQMRVATVTEVVGKRLHLKYHGAPPDDNGFWCHEDAPIIHPVGWSREVGHEIVASQSYHEKCISGTYDPNDAPPELFAIAPIPIYFRNSKLVFCEGMKLEAIDPLNLSAICVATVMKVLHNNYLMIRIDSYESDNTCSDWFCYHATSPCIFPAGFCEMNNITLTPPRGYEGQFSWFTYLKKTQATAAPPALFNRVSYSSILAELLPAPEEEHCSTASKVRRGPARKDARRSPRGTAITANNTKTLPVRATRARTLPTSYNQSDDDDVSDETSSGVASLDGNESSGEAWDMDERSCNPSSVSPVLPQTELQSISTQHDLTSSSITENKVQDVRNQTVQLDQKLSHGNSSQPVSMRQVKDAHVLNNSQSVSEDNQLGVQANIQSSLPQPVSKSNNTQSTSLKPNTTTTTPSTPKDASKPQVPVQPQNHKNGIFQQSKSTSQSPIVSSTVTTQASSTPQVSVLSSETQSESQITTYIPRLIDGPVKDGSKVKPKLWTPQEVAQFLKTNDCGAYCDNFILQNIHGSQLLTLSQNDVMGLTGMKVGPSLKIHDLVQQLLALVNPAQARYQATLMKRGLSFT